MRQILRDRFHAPVEVDDASRTMALAEIRFGAATEARQFTYVMLGAGTGAALFLNGGLYTGSAGFAGEFGHITVDPNGPPCTCGNRGCIEALASASALVRRAQEAVISGLSPKLWTLCAGDPGKVSMELIVQAAKDHDRFSLGLLNDAGTHIGIGIVGLVNLVDPELIVFGGGFATATAEFTLPAIERLAGFRGQAIA